MTDQDKTPNLKTPRAMPGVWVLTLSPLKATTLKPRTARSDLRP